jgi:metal-sulfur cluster biosynthetic enzyme
LESRVLDALGTVYDPELDEPITTLGFVGSCVVDRGDVSVRLRLPTPQCAPNFAFLMAADAARAVRSVAGVKSVDVVLEDHYTGREINAAVNRGEDFDGAFPGESEGSLEALRVLFQRKALLARQSRLLSSRACASCDGRWASTRPTARRRSSPATAWRSTRPICASSGWRR